MLFDLALSTLLAHLVVLFIAFPFHELAHAAVADYFGDDTPRLNGRLTLNPLAHLDPMGSLLLVVAGFGWAKPVPINPYALQRRSPAAVMLVSLAGPMSNLLLAIVAAIPFRLGLIDVFTAQMDSFNAQSHLLPTIPQIMLNFVFVNLLLMLFNLIPLAPLDGDKILSYFLPPSFAQVFDNIRPYGPMILIGLLFLGPYVGLDLVGWVIMPPLRALASLLIGVG